MGRDEMRIWKDLVAVGTKRCIHTVTRYLGQSFQLHPRLSAYSENTTEFVHISRGIASKMVVHLGAEGPKHK